MSSAMRKSRISPPTNLLTEKDNRENDRSYGEVENTPAKPGPKPEKLTTPNAAATPKLTAMITAGPTTAISSPRPLRGLNPTPAQTAASLTTRNGEGDSECDRDHRNGNSDQRCDSSVRQCERNGER
jgi:hypothetical protein